MIEEKKINKKMLIIIAIALIMLIGGMSLALWQFTYEGTEDNVISSEDISIEYLESTDVIDIKNALPLDDGSGKVQSDTFDFEVTTKTGRQTNMSYTLTLEELTLDEGYSPLTSSQIKVYLEDYNGNALVGPTKVSELRNYVLYSDTNAHNSTNKEIVDKYKLRAWIDEEVDATGWSQDTKLQYKFRINVSATDEVGEELAGLSDAAKAFAVQVAASNVGDQVSLKGDQLSEVYTPTYQYYVLAKEDNKALLMYYSSGGGGGNGYSWVTFDDASNSWRDSSLRAKLNSTENLGFLSDKTVLNELIMDTTVYTRDASNLSNFVTTTDRVFIMSEADRLGTNQGTPISYTDSPNDYTIAPDEADADGNIIPDEITIIGNALRFENDIMWLRTPGTDGKVRYATTRSSGSNGEESPSVEGVVLPIFWIDISSANAN